MLTDILHISNYLTILMFFYAAYGTTNNFISYKLQNCGMNIIKCTACIFEFQR